MLNSGPLFFLCNLMASFTQLFYEFLSRNRDQKGSIPCHDWDLLDLKRSITVKHYLKSIQAHRVRFYDIVNL